MPMHYSGGTAGEGSAQAKGGGCIVFYVADVDEPIFSIFFVKYAYSSLRVCIVILVAILCKTHAVWSIPTLNVYDSFWKTFLVFCWLEI
jgi:hypothetical protein